MAELVGRARACRYCGKSIKFNMSYDVSGTRKYLPANLDGSDHRCQTEKFQELSQRTVEDVLKDLALSLNLDTTNLTTTKELAVAVGIMLGMTSTEVMQRCDNLLKMEKMQGGQNISGTNGAGTGGNGQGSGNSGSDSGSSEGTSGDISDLVDQAVEDALRAKNAGRGQKDAEGEADSGSGSESVGAEASDGTEGEQDSNGNGDGAGENSSGDATKGQRTSETSGGDEEEVSATGEGDTESEEAPKKDEEGAKKGSKGKEKDGESVKVDKEILKRIAQNLKEQIKKETTVKHEHVLKLPDATEVDVTGEHYMFKEFVQLLSEGEKPFLVGPAGSGKTTAALNAAPVLGKVFGREDYTTYVKSFCLMSGKHEMEGFIDANGHCVDTDFRTAFVEGHLFFMDEADAANPNILLVLNAAIENKIMSFPDGMKRAHDHFRIAVGANTIGLGADAQYSGRTQLDAAFRNRFYFLAWEYDEEMEMKWAGADQAKWVTFVQGLRKAQQSMGRSAPRVVISPRASIRGARRLRAGLVKETNAGFAKLAEALIWQGCHEDDKKKILENAAKLGGKRK